MKEVRSYKYILYWRLEGKVEEEQIRSLFDGTKKAAKQLELLGKSTWTMFANNERWREAVQYTLADTEMRITLESAGVDERAERREEDENPCCQG